VCPFYCVELDDISGGQKLLFLSDPRLQYV